MSIVDSMSERYIEQIEDLRAEIERLRTQLELHKQNNKDVFATCEVEIDRLRTALEAIADGMYRPGTPPREIVSSMRATARAALGATGNSWRPKMKTGLSPNPKTEIF